MKHTFLQTYFTFTRSQRSGLMFLFAIVAILQLSYCFVDFSVIGTNPDEKREWLAFQPEIDSLKKIQPDKPKIYPFNPNFITDFKGYRLGMSVAEIDRLHALRKGNKYVNSAAEFQAVTHVSDSLLAVISPYFKFPDWVANKASQSFPKGFAEKVKITKIDINTATKEDLMKIYGIGTGLSDRILKQKETLGGFVSMTQMEDIWGLQPEVVEKLNERFKVSGLPDVKKIPINTASVKELSQFPYFRYALAKEIVTYRSMNGNIANAEDLLKIKGFPTEKINIIAVYLEF